MVLVGLLAIPNISFAQTAKEAIKALMKIEAKCQVGIAYNNYMSALADAKYEINAFLESSKANKNPELANHIKMALAHYQTAGELWHMDINKDAALSKALLKGYPQANKNINQGGAIISVGKIGEWSIDVKAMLSIIWAAASAERKKASLLLSE